MPSTTVDCGDFTIEMDDGTTIHPREGQQVRFKRKVSGRMVRLMLDVMQMGNLDSEDADSTKQLGESLDELVPRLVRSIIDWNFLDIWNPDDDGVCPPLPIMPTADDIWDLGYDEIFYLVNKLFEQLQAPKN
jgi:hypothetical protein